MKKLLIASIVLSLSFSFTLATPTNAGACFSDPVHDRAWHGEVTTSAFVRDVACMDGSEILTTITKGSVINIIGETDGWYKVTLSDGTTGWVGQQLMQITSKDLTLTKTTTPTSTPTPTTYINNSTTDPRLARLKGYIFLAVQKNGEAYYYYPVDNKGHYLGRPADAFSIMRKLGLGAKHDFIHNTTNFPDHVVGRILLDVEMNGEAYYIYPKDRKKYYLGRPHDAFRIMRELGLGISNADLNDLAKVN